MWIIIDNSFLSIVYKSILFKFLAAALKIPVAFILFQGKYGKP